ncbi:MAG: hypothetical protein JO280_08600 [Mycobacteriaceae bacterium]|nr:hypothetical protein [Mycobacteriaceae bacterium]
MTLDIYADLFDDDLDDQRPAGRGDSSCCGQLSASPPTSLLTLARWRDGAKAHAACAQTRKVLPQNPFDLRKRKWS